MDFYSYFMGFITFPIGIGIIILFDYLNEHWFKAFRKNQRVYVHEIIHTMEVLPKMRVWHLFGPVFFTRTFSLLVCKDTPGKKSLARIKEMTKERA